MSYQQWAEERLAGTPGAVTHPDLARADYLMWASDRRLKPELRSKQRGAVRAVGGRMKGIGKGLRYHDIEIRPLVDGVILPPEVVLAALRALKDAGLVTDKQALNRAYVELNRRHRG